MPVMLLFLLLLALVFTQHTIHVLLVEQQLAHLIARTPVFGIRRLFFGKQLGIFLLQALDGWQLFDSQLVKGFLRRVVQKDVALVLREILFRVTGLAVSCCKYRIMVYNSVMKFEMGVPVAKVTPLPWVISSMYRHFKSISEDFWASVVESPATFRIFV